jgi:hypothetical protein
MTNIKNKTGFLSNNTYEKEDSQNEYNELNTLDYLLPIVFGAVVAFLFISVLRSFCAKK